MKSRPMSLHWTLLAFSSLMAVAVPVLRAAADETPSAMLQSITRPSPLCRAASNAATKPNASIIPPPP